MYYISVETFVFFFFFFNIFRKLLTHKGVSGCVYIDVCPTSLFLDPADLESNMARDLSWFTKSLSDLQHKYTHCNKAQILLT